MTELPPELAAEGKSIENRRRVAQLLMQQGMQPVRSVNQRSPVSWTQGMAQVANAYFGRQGMNEADQAESALGKKYQEGLGNEVKRIAALRQGQPVPVDPQEIEQSADQGTPMPRTSTGDPRASVMAALTSQYGPVREMGKLDFQGDLKTQENAAARAARLEERLLTITAAADEKDLDRVSRERMAKDANDVRRELAELKAFMQGGGGNPYFTPVYTPQGVMSFNNRTGGAEQTTVNGQPITRSGDDPNLQQRLAGAKTAGKAEAERKFNMTGIGSVIKQAEDILGGKTPPTGSGAGAIVDKVAGFFGMSPSGAKEATALKAVAGALTSKMPRMEGPQSDRDTALYREMAAQVGDENMPVDQRKHALTVVKSLWEKYGDQNPDAFERGAGVPAGVDPKLWEVMTPQERAAWQK